MRSGLVILAFLAAVIAGTLHAQVQQTQRTKPAARSLLGKLYLGMERFDAAVQELEEARKWAPDDQETKLALASVYLRQKRPERAEALFADMLKALGDSPQLRILFGVVYFENEYVDRTTQQFKHAASLSRWMPTFRVRTPSSQKPQSWIPNCPRRITRGA